MQDPRTGAGPEQPEDREQNPRASELQNPRNSEPQASRHPVTGNPTPNKQSSKSDVGDVYEIMNIFLIFLGTDQNSQRPEGRATKLQRVQLPGLGDDRDKLIW